MELDFNFVDNPIKALVNVIFNIMTWGWIAEISLGILVIMWLFVFAILILERKKIKFLIKDKYYFLKAYLYYYLVEKIRYLKSYWYEIGFRFQHWDSRMWIITITILILFLAFLYFLFTLTQFGLETGGFGNNETFINTELNNISTNES